MRSHFQSRDDGVAWQGPPKIRLKLEGARQSSSPRLCASVRAVPWADEAQQQLSRLALSGGDLSADVRIFRAGLPEAPVMQPQNYIWILCRKTSKQPQSLCLCASSAMGRWGWATSFQASSCWLPAICRRSHFQSRAAGGARHGRPKLRL